ncbi:DUF4430 domain-containing protein [Aeoliella sp. ICT_H6.2]|uniref:DUF4430 domain-containing protein n=1 Tax=Aeoliella straminimaris TaxID=2954799 RepID=A0A9X2JH11_9BACT|nr:DUF4430 domain-containing protein [Aeoliella straminimaris]MCO6042434.1 DUF4430 domain-containing protein [Aeoliella straminimaris]
MYGQLVVMAESPQAAETSPSNKQNWLIAVLLLGVLGIVLAVNFFAKQSVTRVSTDGNAQPAKTDIAPAEGITLLTSGEPSLPTVTVAFQPGMVVLDALVAAEQADSRWQFSYQGTGDSALLISLAGLESQGSDGRNWLYEVNGELAQRSIGVEPVKPGDRVLWKFATYE